MPRIRTIKPEFWSDYRMTEELSRDVRLFYIALWNEADDEGRFQAHPRRVLGATFPYDEDMNTVVIEEWMQKLVATNRLILYVVGGEPYGQLTKFLDHQRINRPTESRLPVPPGSPDDGSVSTHGSLNEPSSPRARASERNGTEQGAGAGAGSGKELEQGGSGRQSVGRQKGACEDSTEQQLVVAAIRVANAGMLDNPLLDKDAFRPIDVDHDPSRAVVDSWCKAAMDPLAILEEVYHSAVAYRPTKRNPQIVSLNYFDRPVRTRAEIDASKAIDRPTSGKRTRSAPAPGSEASRVRTETPGSERRNGVESPPKPLPKELMAEFKRRGLNLFVSKSSVEEQSAA